MPSTVAHLFESAECTHGGSIRWGTPIPERGGGIYVVAMNGDQSEGQSLASAASIDRDEVKVLLDRRPKLEVDGLRPSVAEFDARLRSMWIPGESVLYIGKATSIRSRVRQYYDTSIGARSPHAGGWPLKLLEGLDDLWVHWAANAMPELAEQTALAAFVDAVPKEIASGLYDPEHPYPYANLEGPSGRKRHGIRGATASLQGTDQELPQKSASTGTPLSDAPIRARAESAPTQRVTRADLGAGRIRIPGSSKSLFPSERSNIQIRLRSEDLTVRWDPRFGPPERSGTLGIGKAVLNSLVEPDETLTVRRVGELLSIE